MPYNTKSDGYWGYSTSFLSIPDKFESLDIKINALNYTTKKFQVKSTGEADNYYAAFLNLKDVTKPFSFCSIESNTKIEELNWPDFATALQRPELKLDDLSLIQVGFIKFDTKSYRPTYLTGKENPLTGWKGANFGPVLHFNSASILKNNMKHRINEASVGHLAKSPFDRNGNYHPIARP